MDNQSLAPITMCMVKAGLAAGTTTTLTTTASPASNLIYAIRGKVYTAANLSNTATPTTDWATGIAFNPIPIPATAPNLAVGYGSIFMVGLDAGGTVRVIQGSIEAMDATPAFIRAPQFGGLGPQGSASTDNNFCPIGYIIVKLGSTAVATWTFGTNNLSSVTGVTYTFVDVCTIPDRPQVA